MSDNQKYYKTLQIKANASRMEIKKSYRILCRQLNVAKIFNKNNKYIEYKLNEIENAYKILIDPIQRKLYDRLSIDLFLLYDILYITDNNLVLMFK